MLFLGKSWTIHLLNLKSCQVLETLFHLVFLGIAPVFRSRRELFSGEGDFDFSSVKKAKEILQIRVTYDIDASTADKTSKRWLHYLKRDTFFSWFAFYFCVDICGKKKQSIDIYQPKIYSFLQIFQTSFTPEISFRWFKILESIQKYFAEEIFSKYEPL